MNINLENILDSSIDRLNELLPTGDALPKDRTVVLLGPGAKLDSMGFVNLLVAIEDELNKRHGITTALATMVSVDGQNAYTIGDLQALLIRIIHGQGRS
jgi:acyl carrier protein